MITTLWTDGVHELPALVPPWANTHPVRGGWEPAPADPIDLDRCAVCGYRPVVADVESGASVVAEVTVAPGDWIGDWPVEIGTVVLIRLCREHAGRAVAR